MKFTHVKNIVKSMGQVGWVDDGGYSGLEF